MKLQLLTIGLIASFTGIKAQTNFSISDYHSPTTKSGVVETVIGTTTFDYQSNSSNQDRVYLHSDGTFSATWLYSNATSGFSDRGTGYNYFDGTSWAPNPTSRVENERIGFPAFTATASGKEFVVSHDAVDSLLFARRNSKGTGQWQYSRIPSALPGLGIGLMHPIITTGGTNGETVHVFALSNGDYNGFTETAILYYRSLDGGLTWDKQDVQIQGLNPSLYGFIPRNAYNVHANGNTVALAMFHSFGDLSVFKSTDNGNTWTISTVEDYPVDGYVFDTGVGSDINGDGTADQVHTTTGAGAILVDGSGLVHITYAKGLNEDVNLNNDATEFFYGGSDSIMYWNENMGTGGAKLAASSVDADGDGVFTAPSNSYLPGLSDRPSISMDNVGDIYISYLSGNENHTVQGGYNNHIYLTKTYDAGTTWTLPRDLTTDITFLGYEYEFPSMPQFITDQIHVVSHRDFSPGSGILGDHNIGSVDVVHLAMDTGITQAAFDVGVSSIDAPTGGSIAQNFNDTIKFTVMNFGDEIPGGDTITVVLSIGSTQLTGAVVTPGLFQTNASLSITAPVDLAPFNLVAGSSLNVCASAIYPGDVDPANNETCKVYLVAFPDNIDEYTQNNFTVFYANKEIVFEMENENEIVKILDVSGKEINSFKMNRGRNSIPFDQSPGIYLIKSQSGTAKILVQ
jgi:hypothetical protein